MSTAVIGAGRAHRQSACRALHEIGTGGGGRAVIVADGRPPSSADDRAPAGSLYAGLHRAGVSTLLEAALTWLDPRNYDAVLLVTGFGRHVPAMAVSDRHRSGEQALAWWLKGAPDATAPSAPASQDNDDDEGLIGSAGDRPARPEGSSSGLLSDLTSRAWPDRMKAVLDVIGMEVAHRERRCLVMVDEAVLHPRLLGEHALRNEQARSEFERQEIERRFMALPRLVADSRRHDVILLCRTAKHAQWVSSGGLIREELVANAAGGSQTGPLAESLRVEAARNAQRFSELRWSDTPVLVMPAIDIAQPFGPWLQRANPERPLYEALRQVPLSAQDDPLDRLNDYVGMAEVRSQLERLQARLQIEIEEAGGHLPNEARDRLHVVFYGPPGTGKTTIAGVLSQIYSELGLLPANKWTQKRREDFVAGYQGQTALKTIEACKDADGGILFIDEAYDLQLDDNDMFGKEAIGALSSWMDSHLSSFIVILAGYEERMRELFKRAHPGFARRFTRHITFREFTDDELVEIASRTAARRRKSIADDAMPVVRTRLRRHREACAANGVAFGNAGDVDTLVAKAIEEQAVRLMRKKDRTRQDLECLTAADFEHAQFVPTGGRSGA